MFKKWLNPPVLPEMGELKKNVISYIIILLLSTSRCRGKDWLAFGSLMIHFSPPKPRPRRGNIRPVQLLAQQ